MTDDIDPLTPQVQALQAAGEQKFGADCFTTMIQAVGVMGVPQNVLRSVVSGGNALGDFTQLSQDCLLKVMQSTNSPKDPAFRRADEAYSEIRQQQRDQWHDRNRRR
jgi:hypothetical protein